MSSGNTLKQIAFIFLFLIFGSLAYLGFTNSSLRVISIMQVMGLHNIDKKEFLDIVSRLNFLFNQRSAPS
jgi:hypothetical protein